MRQLAGTKTMYRRAGAALLAGLISESLYYGKLFVPHRVEKSKNLPTKAFI